MVEINWRQVSNQLRIESTRFRLISEHTPPSQALEKSMADLKSDIALMLSSALDIRLPKRG